MNRISVTDCNWKKQEILQDRDYTLPSWATSHALVPLPLVIDERTIRVFCSFLDDDYIGRIAWLELKYSGDKFEVSKVSKKPFLDVGNRGTFAEFGTGLGTFWPRKNPEFLAFIGFSRPPGYKFKAFSGLVALENIEAAGSTPSSIPWLSEPMGGSTIVGIHDLISYDGSIYGFVSLGDSFEMIDGKPFPRYQVGLLRGRDLSSLKLERKGIFPVPEGVYRMGRPRVEITNRGIEVLVTAGSTDGQYFPLAFYSRDLIDWELDELKTFRSVIIPNFDDQHQCYLSRFSLQGKEFIVYNGNDMGKFGFGLATALVKS